MHKVYSKPSFDKRDVLATIAAQASPAPDPG